MGLSKGGAIYAVDTDVTILESEFIHNHSSHQGGAIFLDTFGNPSTLQVSASLFESNSSKDGAGAVCAKSIALSCNLEHSTFRKNISNSDETASGFTIASVLLNDAHDDGFPLEVRIAACRFEENQNRVAGEGQADGGALAVSGNDAAGDVTRFMMDACTFSRNFAHQGAGFYNGRYAVGTIRNSLFQENRARYRGGALYRGGAPTESMGETTILEYCIFLLNGAGLEPENTPSPGFAGQGGAVYCRENPRLLIRNCTFLENTVVGGESADGMALYHRADGSGNGVFDEDDERCEIYNSIFYSAGARPGYHQIVSRENHDADNSGFRENGLCSNARMDDAILTGSVETRAIPLFANPFAAGDRLELSPGPPCINAGMDFGLHRDFYGTLVPQCGKVDIGAVEYSGFVQGDVYVNGDVDLRDALYALAAAAHRLPMLPFEKAFAPCGDVNGDLRVGIEEALFVLRHLAGL